MRTMSPSGPFDGPSDRFDGEPDPAALFGDMANALSNFAAMAGRGGGPNWEQARAMAASIATGGTPEPNIDPLDRMNFEALVRVAELQVTELTEFSTSGIRTETATRSEWATRTVDEYRPMLERVSESLTRIVASQLDELTNEDFGDLSEALPGLSLPPGLDLNRLFGDLAGSLGPTLAVSLAASVVGQLASRAFGTYDLPLPRPAGASISVILAAVDEFGRDWSLPTDDLRLWWCLHEMTHHVVLELPHVGERLAALLAAHAGAFEADPAGIEERFGTFDPDDPDVMQRWSELMSRPDQMLTTLRSAEQTRLIAEIDTIVCCIVGYVDWVLDTIGRRLLTDSTRISEALRRRRVEADAATKFVERIFGLELTQPKIDVGSSFVQAVAARHGADGVGRIWSDAAHLPTRAELDTPGIWMARVGLAEDEALPELEEPVEIPDFPEFD